MAALRLALLLCTAPVALASLSDYTVYRSTDITPCVPPCNRVGNCGNYPPSNGPCNVTWLAEQCSLTYGCVAFNSNGWLKGCGNVSCGVSFEGSSIDTYVNTSSGGMPPPPLPCPPQIVPVQDEHYPDEEPAEAAGAAVPALLSAGAGWALLQLGAQTANASTKAMPRGRPPGSPAALLGFLHGTEAARRTPGQTTMTKVAEERVSPWPWRQKTKVYKKWTLRHF
jgi:hypothetical protein